MKNTYFMHYRRPQGYAVDLNSKGGATVAIRVVEPGKAVVAIARCSNKEVFNKKIGRSIAEGRLNAHLSGDRVVLEKNFYVVPLREGEDLKTSVDMAVGDVMAELDLY